MQFTGERFIPGIDDPRTAADHRTLACEHWHRYLYATQFAAGKAVLDVACGEGYGSRLLAETAARVIGVDSDPEAVREAASRYPRPNLEFRTGSVERLPPEGEHLFDLVVSFETIEHVWADQQRAFLGEVRRVLRPGGRFIVSTPNKAIYHDESHEDNPFHLKELYFDEFQKLLAQHFRSVQFLGQRIHRVVGKESDATTRTQAEEFIEQVRQDAKHERLALPHIYEHKAKLEAARPKLETGTYHPWGLGESVQPDGSRVPPDAS